MAKKAAGQTDAEFEEEMLWFDNFERAQARKKAAMAKLTKAVKKAMGSEHGFEHPSGPDSFVIVHRSTYPGVVYQVSRFDHLGPVGHSEASNLDDAAERVWEELDSTQRQGFYD